jgi:phosphohistidine phosphatase
MRHGDAVKPAVAYAQRPLSDRGKREADAAGAFLRMANEIPYAIMHSTQLRSKMTAEHVMAGVAVDGLLQERCDLEEDSSAEDFLASIVSEFGETNKKIMIVGHNPFMSRLAFLLFAGSKPPIIEEFKTGTLLAADSAAHGRMWTLRFYMPTKPLAEFYSSLVDPHISLSIPTLVQARTNVHAKWS